MERQAAGLKHCITIFSILLWNWIASPAASAHPIVQYWQNRSTLSTGLVFEPRLSWYSTSDHFANDSNKVALPSNISVNRQYLDLNVTYPLGDAWTVFGRLSLLRSQIKNSPTGDSTAFGAGDQLVGTAYRLIDSPGGFRWTAQAEVTIPAYSNGAQKQNGQPYLGDGSFDFQAGSFVGIPVASSGEWLFEAGAAYRHRSHSFSSAIPYSLLFKRDPMGAGFVMNAGVRGQLSLDTDGSTTGDQILGGGGSDLIDAINPAWMVAQVMGGIRTASGPVYSALLGYPVSGKNAPSGLQISLSAQFDFGGARRPAIGNVAESGSATTAATAGTASAAASKRNGSKPSVSRGNRKSDESLSYTLNAEVTSVNDALYLCKIDLGASDGIHRGQIFDIFRFVTDSETGLRKEERVARAQVTSVKNSEAALSVIEYFVDQWVEVGFIARRLVE